VNDRFLDFHQEKRRTITAELMEMFGSSVDLSLGKMSSAKGTETLKVEKEGGGKRKGR